MAQTEVPDFAKKIELFIRLKIDDDIKEKKDIARRLGFSQQNLSMMFRGSADGKGQERRPPNMVPNKHLAGFCELLGVTMEQLLGDYALFERLMYNRAAQKITPPIDWLVSQSNNSRAWIDVYKICPLSEAILTMGAAIDFSWKDIPLFPGFPVGSKVFIKIAIRDPNISNAFLAVLADKTNNELGCLYPTSGHGPGYELDSKCCVCIPPNAPHDYLQLNGPSGVDTLVAVVTRDALPEPVYAALMSESQDGIQAGLDAMVSHLKGLNAEDWLTGHYKYEVYRTSDERLKPESTDKGDDPDQDIPAFLRRQAN